MVFIRCGVAGKLRFMRFVSLNAMVAMCVMSKMLFSIPTLRAIAFDCLCLSPLYPSMVGTGVVVDYFFVYLVGFLVGVL